MKEFKTESKKILDLVINSIYSTKEVFLRELISNASDSLDKVALKRAEESATSAGGAGNTADSPEELFIELSFDYDARTITVSDNGIGMTAEQLETDLGTIAHSSSLEVKSAEEVKENEETDIIGQFGVGFYSSFMVADNVTVTSRAYGSDEANQWYSDGIEGFTIEPAARENHGTDVVLHLRSNDAATDYTKFLSYPALEELVKRYSDYIRYPIYLETTGRREVPRPAGARRWEPTFEEYTERRVLNSMVPIWTKPRAEVTQQEYNSFYMNEFQDPHPPLRTITMHARGSHSCDVLLYIPSEPSGDFYSRDYKKGLKLYSSGVLIDEQSSALIPEYFGFVRGVVDSPDLSLNLSREGAQDDPFLLDIAKQIDKRLQHELDVMRDEERDTYVEFYSNFGRTFKFAIYATFGALNEQLENYLMFFTALKDEPVTLKEYREAMPANQPCLLFASGNEADKLEASPSVKAVTDKGFDVLLCSESVDEFSLMTLREYAGLPIKNVASDDLVLDDADDLAMMERVDAENAELFSFMRDLLPSDVVQVRSTTRLSSVPACITAKGPVSLGMEKYFTSTGEESGRPQVRHALEVNPTHHVFETLKQAFADGDRDKVTRYAHVLYGQAMLAEGLEIKNMKAYSQAVYSLM
ncbi:MAG: molecular chaperone HtpG [Eggerthellaceae bacterium]|nr:molecular chaperone HtpG [Eggerthellaceae bacterium]